MPIRAIINPKIGNNNFTSHQTQDHCHDLMLEVHVRDLRSSQYYTLLTSLNRLGYTRYKRIIVTELIVTCLFMWPNAIMRPLDSEISQTRFQRMIMVSYMASSWASRRCLNGDYSF